MHTSLRVANNGAVHRSWKSLDARFQIQDYTLAEFNWLKIIR